MRHPQRLLLTFAALFLVSSCRNESPQPPPPKVQAAATRLVE
ncbi:efflux RND transporter periplasmic adaptor subunit, partial [Synechococcus sp. MU1643]|nr:efflux RND transporter periplasmic adaptor subunit [Synechococcus sp. MU1643]